jgi:hypothetical protein
MESTQGRTAGAAGVGTRRRYVVRGRRRLNLGWRWHTKCHNRFRLPQ